MIEWVGDTEQLEYEIVGSAIERPRVRRSTEGENVEGAKSMKKGREQSDDHS